MSKNYSRKQNTDNYQTTIERCTNKGEELLRAIRAKVDSFDDLVDRDARVQGWLGDNRAKVTGTYIDPGIAEQLRPSTDLALNDISHQDIIEGLELIVLDENKALKRIVDETRAWDGKENRQKCKRKRKTGRFPSGPFLFCQQHRFTALPIIDIGFE